MTAPRSKIVNIENSRYYHCISRCVRQAMLCGKGYEHRKKWLEDRVELLAGVFGMAVGGFAILDNHMHLLIRLEPERVPEWSDEEVIRRWIRAFPGGIDPQDTKRIEKRIEEELQDHERVQTYRTRLADLGWFMKALKEPLSRMANKEDGCSGAFWDARYKSIAILDREALLATCAYIDLNVVAAGLASVPEQSEHTSIRQRVAHILENGGAEKLKAARQSASMGCKAIGDLEESHWLCPIQDRRSLGATRAGMFEGFSIGSYLLVVDYTSRQVRPGKASVPAEVSEILDRLDSDADTWSARLKRLFEQRRLKGSYFATRRKTLRKLAAKIGCRWLANLAGCPVS